MRGIGIFILVLWAGLAGLSSCIDRVEEIGNQGTGQDGVLVRLVVSKPVTGKNISAKAIGDPETNITEIQILVFEEGLYKYRIPGLSITNTGTTASFNARLLASDKVLDLYIVANATASVLADEPRLNATEGEVVAELQALFPITGIFPALPMTGHYTLASGLQANQLEKIEGVGMLRAIARADVLVGNVPEFELISIQAYRANNRIQLIPSQGMQTVTTPNVPTDSRMDVNTVVVGVSGNQAMAELYLPESASPPESAQVSGATCIVIGGKYDGSDEVTYYRIDFDPDNIQGSFGQILRNHRYIFTIRSVAGPGWSSADEAANNRSSQINLEIKAWDESTADMYFDTEHHFGVSAREIEVGSKQNASAMIQINTDIPDYTLQWSDESGNVSGSAEETLTNSYFKVEKTAGGDNLIVTALQDNSNNQTERLGYFVITVSRWRILMTIRQVVTDVSGRTINLVSFRGVLGNFGVNLLQPTSSAETRGAGARALLANLSNFSPSGTVPCGGFNLLVTTANQNAITDVALAAFDVIYFNYVSSFSIEQEILPVLRWLENDTKRVLVVSYDSKGINDALLTALLGDYQKIIWNAGNSTPYYLASESAGNFFTDTGPFTLSPYTPVTDGFTYFNNDGSHGEIPDGIATGITPLLRGPGGGIVLGVDITRRVIYVGDIDLFLASGTTSRGESLNSTGTINNNATKLIANLWAWVVRVVMNDEREGGK